MAHAEVRPSRNVRIALVMAGWTAFGALSAAQIHIREITDGGETSWWSVSNIVYFYWCWALVTPLVLWLARAVQDGARSHWLRTVIFVGGGASIIALQTVLYGVAQMLAGRNGGMALGTIIPLSFVRHLAGNVLTLLVLVAIYVALDYYRRAQARRLDAAQVALRASELEATLTRVRLDALLSQLRPHFLFNTLNMVSSLIAKQDQAAATEVIARLGDLLRETFSQSDASETTLEHELRFARHYLEIARLRFGPRLHIIEHVDAAARECLVPRFILQPLVENALVHGVEGSAGDASVELRAERHGESLRVEVRDSGPGFATRAPDEAAGLGLTLVRGRLRQSYGELAELVVGNAPDGGAVVTLRFPARSDAGARVRETEPTAV